MKAPLILPLMVSLLGVPLMTQAEQGACREEQVQFGHFEETNQGLNFTLSERQWKERRTIDWIWSIRDTSIRQRPDQSYVISGKMTHFNVGVGEGLPIFFGEEGAQPRLVAMTNEAGKFSFSIRSLPESDHFLYVTGTPTPEKKRHLWRPKAKGLKTEFFTHRYQSVLSLSCLTARYPLHLPEDHTALTTKENE